MSRKFVRETQQLLTPLLVYLIAALRTNVVFVLLFTCLEATFCLLIGVYLNLARGNVANIAKLLKAAGAFGFLTSTPRSSFLSSQFSDYVHSQAPAAGICTSLVLSRSSLSLTACLKVGRAHLWLDWVRSSLFPPSFELIAFSHSVPLALPVGDLSNFMSGRRKQV